MKRILIILMILTTFLFTLSLSACGGSEEDDVVVIPPEYAADYSYNESHHWKRQLNGVGSTEYAEHENDSGKCYCGYYFKCPNLVFQKKTITELGNKITGYVLVGYNGLDENAYEHVAIPSYYKPEGATELVEVIAIASHVFSPVKNPGYKSIKSVQIGSGIKYIGNGAFADTDITEAIIPNTVIGGIFENYDRGESLGGIFGLFENCSKLKSVSIGNNVITIGEKTFANCTSLEKVSFGSMVKEIRQTAFDNCPSLKELVLDSSICSIPESSVYSTESQKYEPLYQVFSSVEKIYFEMPKTQYNSLLIELAERDARGYIKTKNGTYVSPENYVLTSYGIVRGWCGNAELYFEAEWEYDQNGKPYAII